MPKWEKIIRNMLGAMWDYDYISCSLAHSERDVKL